MKLSELLKKYGVSTTSNFDLIKIAKDLDIRPIYVMMKDEIQDLSSTPEEKLFVVTNLHNSDEPGVHWNCFVWDKKNTDNNYFFDSYGLPPVKEIQDLLKHGTHNTFELQDRSTSLCGQLSIWVLKELKNNRDFLDIIFEIKKENNARPR